MKVILRVFDLEGKDKKLKSEGEFDFIADKDLIMPLLFTNSSRIELECQDEESVGILGIRYIDVYLKKEINDELSSDATRKVIICNDYQDAAERLSKFALDLSEVQSFNSKLRTDLNTGYSNI